MTKRRVSDLDLSALVLANTRFKESHDALRQVTKKIDDGIEVEPGEGEAAFGMFMAAAVHLYTTSNVLVRASNAEAKKPGLIVP